jgi:hypothetical protein
MLEIPHELQFFEYCGISAAPHFKQRGLCGQFVQQRLGVFQIGSVKAFGEPTG